MSGRESRSHTWEEQRDHPFLSCCDLNWAVDYIPCFCHSEPESSGRRHHASSDRALQGSLPPMLFPFACWHSNCLPLEKDLKVSDFDGCYRIGVQRSTKKSDFPLKDRLLGPL